MRRRVVLVVLVALGLSAASPASVTADNRSVSDPTDDGLLIDPVDAYHRHAGERHRLLVHGFIARSPWQFGPIFGFELKLWVDRPAKGRPDLLVGASDNSSDDFPPPETGRAAVFDRSSRRVGSARTSRPSDTDFRIRVPRRLLGRDAPRYRWSLLITSGCQPRVPGQLCGGPKVDRVPDTGSVVHRLVRREGRP